MTIDSRLDNPLAVVIGRTPVASPLRESDFKFAGRHIMKALGVRFEGKRVVFKPNVTSGEHFRDPDSGITTHPAFVHGLIEEALEADAGKPYILEDPRNHDNNRRRHWRGTGYREVAAATGARLRCPKTYTCIEKEVPEPRVYSSLKVSRLATDPKVTLINVPKFKTHNLAATTLNMKNLMGVVNVADRHYCRWAWNDIPEDLRAPDRLRTEESDKLLHERWQHGLADRLADTAKVARPALNIIEGVVGRDGTGFRRGKNYPLGLVVAGINMVAVDAVASYLMGFDPLGIIYLKVAAEAGLGENDIKKLTMYQTEDSGIVPCADLDSWRADPAFDLIINIPAGSRPKGGNL